MHLRWTAALALLLGCAADDTSQVIDVPSTVDGARRDAGTDARPASDLGARDVPRVDAPAPMDVVVDVPPPRPTTQRFTCTDCPPSAFPEAGAPACTGGAAALPTIVYPPDGVLLPPNLNLLEVQFDPGAGNTLWEVDFSNSVTDVRVTTRCAPITSVRGRATGTCGFTVPQAVWDALVLLNRGRDAVTMTVRGTDVSAACSSASQVSRQIQFAFEDIQGGIYYWQSAVFGGAPGRTGGIYLHDFGARDATDTAYLESGTAGRCTGCHTLSRDGQRISVGTDDPDADDEFRDVRAGMLRVIDKSAITTPGISPGFQTFSHDHAYMLATTYLATGANHSFALFDGNTGAHVRDVALPAAMLGTQPDWSADDRHVVFVTPRAGTIPTQGDHHFHGGDLQVMDVDAAFAFGAPRTLVPASLGGRDTGSDAANYYPSYSPDGAFVVFNHTTSGDVFYNRNAQVLMATADGASIASLDRLNGGTALTNSWPRWSPFVQPYRAGHILWVTFSSNRDYGVRVENGGLPNCYPPSSPTEDTPQDTNWAHCQQPQIWMAAVGVDLDEFGNGHDTSYPAFWLPFQNITSHNHSAQWVGSVVTRTCVEATGTCPGPGGADCCAGLTCDPVTMRCVHPCVPQHGVCPGAGGAACCDGLPCDPTTMRCELGPG